MSKKLIVSDGKREYAVVLDDMIIVGCDPTCDVSHEDDLLSRRHAAFTATGDSVNVRDLGSRNGIFVNGLRTAERTLYPGDVVQVGPLRVLYAFDMAPVSIHPEQMVSDGTVLLGAPPSAHSTPGAAAATIEASEPTRPVAPPVRHPPAAPGARESIAPTKSTTAPTTASLADPKITPSSGASAPRITPPPATPPRPSQPPVSAAPLSPAQLLREAELSMDPLGPWAPSVPSATTIGRSVESELRGYVFAQSITLAGVALASAILPLALLRPDVLGVWLAIPFVATILAVYLVATFINRRFARIVRALKPDGSLSGESFRGRDFWR